MQFEQDAEFVLAKPRTGWAGCPPTTTTDQNRCGQQGSGSMFA